MTISKHSAVQLDTAKLQRGSQLRAMGGAELARLGEESLRSHLVDMAIVAHSKYAPVMGDALQQLLDDRDLVRYPVKIVFGIGNMASHQFAQPEFVDDRYQLYLHPNLEGNEADIALAVGYFIPVINYGKLIEDDHCLLFGATLSGLTVDSYYNEICRIADSIGVPARDRSVKGDRF